MGPPKKNSTEEMDVTCAFAKNLKKIRQIWPRRSLKHFTAAYRGFPPCTQSQPPINRETGYSNVLVWGYLVLSGGVLCCLGVDRKMLRAVWDAFMGVSGTWVSLGCYLRAQPLRDRAWVEQLYHVCTTPNNKICFTWLY